MDLAKLQAAYKNVIAEITKAYFANYDFVVDPRKLVAAEQACFSLLKRECAEKLRVHSEDLAILKLLSDASNLHRETARVIRKSISNRVQEREGRRETRGSGPGQQAGTKPTAEADPEHDRKAGDQGGRTEQKSGSSEQDSYERRQNERQETEVLTSRPMLRTAIIWIILSVVICFVL
jgi:hypothetical protein